MKLHAILLLWLALNLLLVALLNLAPDRKSRQQHRAHTKYCNE